MPLSKAAIKRRIKAPWGDCPSCGESSEELDYGDLDPVEDGDIEQRVICPTCNCHWKDIFRLVEVHELFSPRSE